MVTATHQRGVFDNAYAKTYAALQERDLPLGFHAMFTWSDQSLRMMNRFIGVHALGFTWYNMLHMTNWVVNGMMERFPRLRSEEHTSELQSLMRTSYAVFCLKKKQKSQISA